MLEKKLKRYIKDDETVIEIVRKYLFLFLFPITFGSVLIIASFFLMYPLLHYWAIWGIASFILLVALGIFIILRSFVVYSLNVFIITNKRIIDIDQKGFFDRTVSETSYDKIQDVSFRIKGIMQTFLHFGNIVIQTAGSQANIELHGVKDPERIQRIIIDLQKEGELESKSAEELPKR